ncbi:MAG: hypothetical protein JW791_00925 [Nanoarchaeota archaeon]|nr:hypothetical protein [Nanoarchaeota archaeon]
MSRRLGASNTLIYVGLVILAVLAIIVIVRIFGGEEGFAGQLLNSSMEKVLVIYRLLTNG